MYAEDKLLTAPDDPEGMGEYIIEDEEDCMWEMEFDRMGEATDFVGFV